MIPRLLLLARPGTLPLLTLLLTGCAGMNMGSLADILASGAGLPGSGANLSGEIRSIDTRRQEIELSSGWGGAEWVRYDNRTEVLYQQRRYDIRDLERGDYVQIQLDEYAGSRGDRDNRLARTIHVQQSVAGRDDTRQPTSGNRRIERIDGTIARLDQRQGWFEIEDRYGSPVTVTLPYQANRGLTDRFDRLRRGDRVTIEGERLNASRMEVHRFM